MKKVAGYREGEIGIYYYVPKWIRVYSLEMPTTVGEFFRGYRLEKRCCLEFDRVYIDTEMCGYSVLGAINPIKFPNKYIREYQIGKMMVYLSEIHLGCNPLTGNVLEISGESWVSFFPYTGEIENRVVSETALYGVERTELEVFSCAIPNLILNENG